MTIAKPRSALRALLCLALLGLLLQASPARAQELKTFAVTPFSYSGPEAYRYLEQAIPSMLSSRLAWPGHFEPAEKASIAQAGLANAPGTESQALAAIDKLGVDYLVWGAVTIVEKQADIGVKLKGRDGTAWSGSSQVPMDQIIQSFQQTAVDIRAKVFGRPAEDNKAEIEQAPVAQIGPQNPDIVMAQDKAGFQPTTLNPQFRYEGGTETTGRWRSQTLRFPSRGMGIGDVTGDGQNEVVLLGDDKLSVWKFDDSKLKPLGEVELSSKATYLRMSLVDLDRDGAMEILVSAYRDQGPHSTIFSFKGGGFKTIADNLRMYLNVIGMPPTFSSTLIGQKRGRRGLFDTDAVQEMHFSGGELVGGKKIKVPPFGNVFNIAYLPDKAGGFKIVVVDDFNRLKVYSPNCEIQYASEETYNSSMIILEVSRRQYGMGPGKVDDYMDTYNVPMRMVPVSFDRSQYELLLNKDISVAAEIFDRYKTFSQGEIHSMFWDGVGLNLAWKTRRIKGTVVDFCLADLNNDGKKDLCVCLNTFPGVVGFAHRKTVVLTYDLNLDN
ncbi:MAG: VCBS repeat-containing protein [Desulfovibrionaceae bacterium]|nr:VCBS repeat-containing protein [Desulfovibrionaceae bacterium]